MWLDVKNTLLVYFIQKEDFTVLPKNLQNRLENDCISKKESKKFLEYSFSNHNLGENISKDIAKFFKTKQRSEYRKDSMLEKSAGLYEKEDIENIYKIQKGLCYYSGKPLHGKYSIDHIKPVRSGGNSWPENIALVLKEINQEKHGKTKTAFLNKLKKSYGKQWFKKQMAFIKNVDNQRKIIDKRRKTSIINIIKSINKKLQKNFINQYIDLNIVDEEITLRANRTIIYFPKGFIRNKNKSQNINFYRKLLILLF